MRYASVCSGVEAASLAWLPLGWEAAWFSEIEPFPCAVLQERFPGVPNLGDMTKIHFDKERNVTYVDGSDVVVPGGIDLLVGGTPCQSFSVAGKREGLDGASALAYHYVRLLKELAPKFFVWENVPGCLSSRNKSGGYYEFNFLLAAYAECGFNLAWRVLDAQYCRVDGYPRAVPQRRRRVFVVGCAADSGIDPEQILFEPESLLGDTPPRRIKGKGFAEGSGTGFADPVRRSGSNGSCGNRGIESQSSAAVGNDTGNGGGRAVGTVLNESRFWDGKAVANTLTVTSNNQLEPDRGRLQCLVEDVKTDGALFEINYGCPLANAVSHTLKCGTAPGTYSGVICYKADSLVNYDTAMITGDHDNRPTDFTNLLLEDQECNKTAK